MKRLLGIGLALAFFASLVLPAAPQVQAAAPQTYQVLVGWENSKQGVDIEAFFPETVVIHVGDTVHWKQNSHEIHTVTFLSGSAMPDLIVAAPAGAGSPVMLNPAAVLPTAPANGQYNGAGYANSGLMGLDPGQATDFSLTFTQAGTYDYICLVHGMAMSGKVIVKSDGWVASPAQSKALGQRQIAQKLRGVPAVFEEALKLVKPPSRNPDGTTTFHVLMGYGKGQIDLMRFFPRNLVVHPGDKVVWELPSTGMAMAPHTVTFLNGNPELEFVQVSPQPSGPPLLLLNPAVLAPIQPGVSLTRSGIFSSGLLDPANPSGPHSYAMTIGNITGKIDYMCVLHDASGMTASLTVAPRR